MTTSYNYRALERKWRKIWTNNGLSVNDCVISKYSCLDMLPDLFDNKGYPDAFVRDYGWDCLRLYKLFTGTIGYESEWDDDALEGVYRFLNKLWRLAIDCKDKVFIPTKESVKLQNKLIYDIRHRVDEMRFKTIVSGFMEYHNIISDLVKKQGGIATEVLETYMILLAPFAPYIAEELWEQYGHTTSVFECHWPVVDENAMEDEVVQIAVQLNGKTKMMISVSSDSKKDDVIELAKNALGTRITGTVMKEVYIPKKVINFVIKE